VNPLGIDLFCGLGGWTEGLLAEGYDVVGFDIERHVYGEHRYPAQLVLQDVRTLHGRQFKDASVIVASPPCQKYSYMAMPWSRAKQMAAEYRSGVRSVEELNELFNVCFRIAREAGVPLIVENVKGAQDWVGAAQWHYGSFYLWGDVPALMPSMFSIKGYGGTWFFGDHANPARGDNEFSVSRGYPRDIRGRKQEGSGEIWFDVGFCKLSSRSAARKAASAQIAKIPFPLARHIARTFKDSREMVSALPDLNRSSH
jgi:hypothetical protein